MRTVDLARQVGCSVQHVRDLEHAGALPPAERSASGYRSWRQVHLLSALAYRDLAKGMGPVAAKGVLRAVHREPAAAVLARLDEAHAELARERRDLRLAREAVLAIAAEPLDAPRPTDAMAISELATALGTTPATLRHWEAGGLLAPDRSGRARVRTYSPEQVRDVRVVHQLRLAGHRIPQLRSLLPRLLEHGDASGDLDAALSTRDQNLATRSRALLRAAAALDGLLDEP
jgi:DNA-binding transcriptional MerR regulator